ncbi:MAG: hypothetical protein V1755_15840 [Chloroflexota bacterium]
MQAAIIHRKKKYGKVLEGSPVERRGDRPPSAAAHMGLGQGFMHAGFREVARGIGAHAILQNEIGG